jgi:hypothetical protein
MNISGCGVTANMPVLGTGDSGFESQHPDKEYFGLKYLINLVFLFYRKAGIV